MPTIQGIQGTIVEAWAKGFDPRGAHQLGGEELIGSRLWIGPVDCAAALRSFGIAAKLVEVKMKGNLPNDNPLFTWIEEWFQGGSRLPLLLQWKVTWFIVVVVVVGHVTF